MDGVIDRRIEYAGTLPAVWYLDPEVLAQEKLQVFSRTWQLVARVDQVRNPGDSVACMVADEPLVVVRDFDSRVRAFSGVCRHRAGPLACGGASRKAIQCGYHGWTYGLDGKLLGTPEFSGVRQFDKDRVALPEFRVETWGPFVFVNLDPEATPLGETLRDLPDGIEPDRLALFRWAHRKDWTIRCNWKVYVDNYLEGYHIPIVHPGLFKDLDYAAYRTETFRLASVQHAPIRKSPGARFRTEGSLSADARYLWIFPNLMINFYPDNFSTNLILPDGPDRTLTVFEWYFDGSDSPQVREKIGSTVALSDEIQHEDIAICESVQTGLRSRTYSQGRYSVERENGVHHFHRLLAGSMSRRGGDSPARPHGSP